MKYGSNRNHILRYRLGAVEKMMRHIDGSLDADHLDHKNDLKKDIFRRKAQLNQVKTLNFKNIRWKILKNINLNY